VVDAVHILERPTRHTDPVCSLVCASVVVGGPRSSRAVGHGGAHNAERCRRERHWECHGVDAVEGVSWAFGAQGTSRGRHIRDMPAACQGAGVAHVVAGGVPRCLQSVHVRFGQGGEPIVAKRVRGARGSAGGGKRPIGACGTRCVQVISIRVGSAAFAIRADDVGGGIARTCHPVLPLLASCPVDAKGEDVAGRAAKLAIGARQARPVHQVCPGRGGVLTAGAI
jgi:hypothetical protein